MRRVSPTLCPGFIGDEDQDNPQPKLQNRNSDGNESDDEFHTSQSPPKTRQPRRSQSAPRRRAEKGPSNAPPSKNTTPHLPGIGRQGASVQGGPAQGGSARGGGEHDDDTASLAGSTSSRTVGRGHRHVRPGTWTGQS